MFGILTGRIWTSSFIPSACTKYEHMKLTFYFISWFCIALTEPPYQITESGWGEFEANIRIFFRNDQNQDPIDIIHLIKLYPQDSTTSVGSTKVHDCCF